MLQNDETILAHTQNSDRTDQHMAPFFGLLRNASMFETDVLMRHIS